MTLAEQLLDAHVAHELDALRGERFAAQVEVELDHLLAAVGGLELEKVVQRELVTAVALKYVATFLLPGAIPEIAGEIASRVRSHPANVVPLGELVDRARVAELVSVLAEMRGVRERVLRGLADNASLQSGVGEVMRGIAISPLATGRRFARMVPLVGSGIDAAEKIGAGLIDGADQRSREVAERAAGALLGYISTNAAETVSDDELREAVLEVWDALSVRPVGELLGAVSEGQFVELFVAVYELWLDLRTTDYIASAVSSGVEVFFDTYGTFTLTDLLAEFGLGREDLLEEALRFGPPVIEALAETGVLEVLVRRRLAAFYTSPAAQALLAEVPTDR
ncbi:hypothetical protein GCM10011584_01450 [Nocardioides phosphati]|uniref:DUF2336 domain-containing protein n=1 Tax=Nocardioides phosphati TaxID=1867775 RepID=A0ABQ2N4I5_9ACTN|nr:hypothetical protein [Nocardioides phosphati]GGO84279.1 hypothetical protein GCM10011584_01450 [Nocardioides phosphati]